MCVVSYPVRWWLDLHGDTSAENAGTVHEWRVDISTIALPLCQLRPHLHLIPQHQSSTVCSIDIINAYKRK